MSALRIIPAILLALSLGLGVLVPEAWAARKAELEAEHSGGEPAKDAHPGDAGHHGMNYDAVIVQTLGFLILVFILGKFALPPIRNALEGRRGRIRATFEGLERDAQDLETRSREVAAFARRTEEGEAARLQRAFDEGVALRENIVQEGEDAAAKILSKAKLEAQLERDRMVLELRNEVVDLSFVAAEAVVKWAIDEPTQDRLVERFLDGLVGVVEAERRKAGVASRTEA